MSDPIAKSRRIAVSGCELAAAAAGGSQLRSLQAVMMTDTAPLRYRHYHSRDNTPDKLNFDWLVRVVAGLVAIGRILLSKEDTVPLAFEFGDGKYITAWWFFSRRERPNSAPKNLACTFCLGVGPHA